jgi:hypothetical protein
MGVSFRCSPQHIYKFEFVNILECSIGMGKKTHQPSQVALLYLLQILPFTAGKLRDFSADQCAIRQTGGFVD